MEKINNKLCITHSELINPEIGGMTIQSVKHALRTGGLIRVQRGCRGQEAMYEFESIPWKYKKDAQKRLDISDEKEALTPFFDTIEQDGEAWSFYSNYKLPNGDNLKCDVIELYTNTASLLNALANVRELADIALLKAGKQRMSTAEFWRDKSEPIEELKAKYKHNLPSHPKSMGRVAKEYAINGYGALISRKIANMNADKVKSDAQKSTLMLLIGDYRNLDNAQVANLYNMIAEHSVPQWDKINSRTVGNLRDKYKLETEAARRGGNAFNNTMAMQHKRSAPTAPMQYWTLDGWDAELYYQKTSVNGKGHNVTTYTNRVTIVVVLDAFNKYPIGYAIGDHETPALITEALKNAINHTREIFGMRYRTAQIQSDRYGIKTLTPVYQVVAGTVTPAKAHNAKSKIIEPYFKYLNKNYCQWKENWSGFGVTASKNAQPNTEKQNLIKKNFPTYGGVVAQLDTMMETERANKHEAYIGAFRELTDDRKLLMSTESYLLTFGATTGHKNAIEGQGLRPTINGVKREFDCFDINFRKNAHLRWTVLYDPQDLTQALAVSDDGKKRFMLEQKYIQPMALSDRTENDAQALKRVNDFNKELKEHVAERYCLAESTAQQHILENPALRNSLAKSLITNSLGQHKDARNEIRHAIEAGEERAKAPRAKKQPSFDLNKILSNTERIKTTGFTREERLSIY